jgi:hypothetical protein
VRSRGEKEGKSGEVEERRRKKYEEEIEERSRGDRGGRKIEEW